MNLQDFSVFEGVAHAMLQDMIRLWREWLFFINNYETVSVME